MTTTATDVHVTCSDFCGLPITLTGEAGKAQHAEDCGATEADLAKLDRDLSVARIHAAKNGPEDEGDDEELNAALAPEEAPATKFVCSCNESFDTWELLGAHQTETGHEGCANGQSEDDALRERADTVDGSTAKIIHDQAPLPITREPVTLAKALEQLDAAREKHSKAAFALTDAKRSEKEAQTAVNMCVEQLCEVARREAEPELPLDLEQPA